MFGSIGKKASPKLPAVISEFMERIDAVVPWDKDAVDATTRIKKELAKAGTPISSNDAAIAGNALAINCTIVTNNVSEFNRVSGLQVENWTH